MPNDKAASIYNKYVAAYDNEIQGCCLLIADEIQKAVGGEVVAGELTWYGGSCRRPHWWVEKDGQAIDPMGDYLLSFEDYPGRVIVHRDRETFESLLPNYEQWRVENA